VIWPALVLGLVLVGLGVVAAQDALSRWGVIAQEPWLAAAIDGLDGLTAGSWAVPVGAVSALVGVLLVALALVPRRRTHLALAGPADLWLTPAAVETLARDAANGVPGIAELDVRASRSRVRVRAGADDPQRVSGPLEQAVTARLEQLPVRVSTSARRTRIQEDL
jgi:hypothetical protein